MPNSNECDSVATYMLISKFFFLVRKRSVENDNKNTQSDEVSGPAQQTAKNQESESQEDGVVWVDLKRLDLKWCCQPCSCSGWV